MNLKIGHGYDVHRFTSGDHLTLGGVRIPYDYAFDAHSDGDVLIHAVCDAVIGALGEGDIGVWFPDTDEQYRNISSRLLLQKVVSSMKKRGYGLSNLDVTVVAQAPKIAPYIPQMKQHLSEDFCTPLTSLNVKATTTEKLGFIGRSEGIACYAVVLLQVL